MGITRVSDITGLDRIGIPVAMASRPNARSVSVSQGKGVDLDAARASAVMESIETWHAERILLPLRHGSAADLADDGLPLVDTALLPRAGTANYDPREPIFWIQSRDLLDQAAVWVPYEMVSTDYTVPQPPGTGYFPADTNGLASGNTQDEAICHALFEVIERDAESLWRHRPTRQQDACGIDNDSVDDGVCRALIGRFQAAGVTIRIWDITSDTRVPCFICLAVGDDADWADPEFGAGCHPSREIALARALTEAAQARTTFIAGSRDDIGAAPYAPENRRRRRAYCVALAARHRPAKNFRDAPAFDRDDIGQDLAETLSRLRSIGIPQVLVVDLGRPDIGVPVVKVIVPTLEAAHAHHGPAYPAGRRARDARNLPGELAALVS